MALALIFGRSGVSLGNTEPRKPKGVRVGLAAAPVKGGVALELGWSDPVKVDALRPGDHIYSPRLGYTHHGVYAGNRRVIHYHKDGRGEASVQQTSLEVFTGGKPVYRKRAAGRDGAEVVAAARERLGEQAYNLVGHNCEHFAKDCFERG